MPLLTFTTLTNDYLKTLQQVLDNPPGKPLSAEEKIKIKSKISLIKTKHNEEKSGVFDNFSSCRDGGQTKVEREILRRARLRQTGSN